MSLDEVPAPGSGLDAERVYDLVVVGAGPAGLGAAMRGRRLGLEVVVLERLPSPRRVVGHRRHIRWLSPPFVSDPDCNRILVDIQTDES